jgi:hypothetical protein
MAGRSTECPRRVLGQLVCTFLVIVTVFAVMAPVASAARTQKKGPSKAAKMVCTHNAQRELNGVLAAKAQVSTPTWVDHLYSCTYQYATGSFAMSVKVLGSKADAAAYFKEQRAAFGTSPQTPSLGDEAFQEPNGLLVVRKDNDVLQIDPTGLPPTIGKQHTLPRDVAYTAAVVILGCWH